MRLVAWEAALAWIPGFAGFRVLLVLLVAGLASPALAERRVALVLGMDRYEAIRPLSGAVNDARAMEDALEKLGFEVFAETDRDLRRLRRALEDFREDAAGADVALVFYAGHGVEIAGENRLLPVDADASSLEALKASSLPLEEVREVVNAVARVGLVVLDACRNDPFGTSSADGRGAATIKPTNLPATVKPGLGRMGHAENVLFAFAAAPGATASDGTGGNSPFTAALAKYLPSEGLEIRSVFTLVQQEVYDLSRGGQLPYVENGLPALFFASQATGDLPERERLLLAMADVTPDMRAEVERVASDADIPLAPLYAALITSDFRSLDGASRQAALKESAAAFVRLRDERRLLASDDPEVTRLRGAAEDQFALGAPDAADRLLAEAAALDGTSRQALKENFLKRTLSEAASHLLNASGQESAGKLFAAFRLYQKAVAVYAEADAESWPDDDRRRQIVALHALSAAANRLGAFSDALDATDAYAAAATARAAADPANPDWAYHLAAARVMNGEVRMLFGEVDGARAQFELALADARQAAAADPSSLERNRNVGVVLDKVAQLDRSRGDLAAALAAYGEAIEVARRLVEAHAGDLGLREDIAYFTVALADVMTAMGRNDEALAGYRSALAVRRELAELAPADPERRRAVGMAAERVGDLLAAAGDLDGALSLYRERHGIIAALSAASPEDTVWRRDLSVSHEKLGDIAARRKDHRAALDAYRASRDIAAALVTAAPDNTGWQRDLVIIGRKVGEQQAWLGDHAGALATYREGFAIVERLVAVDPGNLEWQSDLASAHMRLAEAEDALGDRAAATKDLKATLAVAEKLGVADPSNVLWQWNLFAAHYQLAQIGETPAKHLGIGLAVLERLVAEGRLPADRKEWPDKVRAELEAAGSQAGKRL